MRGTRRGFTIIELCMSIVCATMLLGMVSMAMRISVQARNQRADQDQAIHEGREALDTIERLLGRAVEIQSWDPTSNTPRISDATGEGGDSFTVNVTGTINLGSGNIPFNQGEVITHNGTSWDSRAKGIPMGTWNPVTNIPDITPSGGTGGPKDTLIVKGPGPGPGPWPWTGPPGQNPGAPPGGFMDGDVLVKRPGPPGPPGGRWTFITYRSGTPTAGPGAFNDTVGAVGDIRFVSCPKPALVPPLPVWTPTFTADLGSGPMTFAQGDILVKGPFGWRKLAHQTAVKNFKNPANGRDDDTTGIQFFADVDPTNPQAPYTDLDAGRKILEWVWIWWDRQQDTDQQNAPFERRGPLKVSIFRAFPSGNPGNEHDTWTRNVPGSLFTLINAPTQAQRAYHTTAGNFGTLQMKVQTYMSPADRNCQQLTWTKRVAVTGGVFADRTGELAAMGTNPWDDVAPGSRFITGAQSRFTSVPSYTFCRSMYLPNAGATTDEQGRSFTFDPTVPANNALMQQSTVTWQTGFSRTTVKNDHVVQPR